MDAATHKGAIKFAIEAVGCMIGLVETPITSPGEKRMLLAHLRRRQAQLQAALDSITSDSPIEYWVE